MRDIKNNKTPEIVMSMTSFPEVLDFAEKTIKTILEGSVLPDRLVLYLTPSEFKDKPIPVSLLNLVKSNPILEIRYYPDEIRSYGKLIPALKDFPEDIIVTIDDDVYYHRNMLEMLLKTHKKHPDAICAHRARKIKPSLPYRKWRKYKWYHFLLKRTYKSPFILPTGVGGVLYPPHSLKEDMLDPELFLKLAPTADDIWFWAAALANDTAVIPVPFGIYKPIDMPKPNNLSLKTVNFRGGVENNVATFNRILDAFPQLKKKLYDEN